MLVIVVGLPSLNAVFPLQLILFLMTTMHRTSSTTTVSTNFCFISRRFFYVKRERCRFPLSNSSHDWAPRHVKPRGDLSWPTRQRSRGQMHGRKGRGLGRLKERPRLVLEVYFSSDKIASLASAEYCASYVWEWWMTMYLPPGKMIVVLTSFASFTEQRSYSFFFRDVMIWPYTFYKKSWWFIWSELWF